MDAALAQIKQLVPADGVARQRLMASLHKLAYSMESPDDTLHRYGAMTLQTACVKIGLDLGLFRYLVESGRPVTVEDMARKTGADGQLLARVLRYLGAIGSVDQDGSNQYAANLVTRNLAQKVTEAGVSHYFSTVSPQYQALPGFLKRTGYGNPTDERHTVFQEAWNTERHGFEWFSERPENLAYFNDFMAARREPELSWLTVYPVRQEAQGLAADRALFLNIGGGIGHQCAQFRERYPDLPGRVLLQDMAHTIAQALPTPGVENMAHDFFEPQPIRGEQDGPLFSGA
ncbi:O-methyl transferase B [Ophiocordyceps sinensis CO18]|uniref:O-methyl transferase B n=1 Tax=Ophiocordyceps sinensis (strain Co18 / CGMCC 3.14243) TaxID=911162 RepID=T5AEP0_OPHSC|nr:O-methyl transferase B [Ophiocordyceps sinensis CO18]